MGHPAHVVVPTNDTRPSTTSPNGAVVTPTSDSSPGPIPQSQHAAGAQVYLPSPRDGKVAPAANKMFPDGTPAPRSGHVASMEADLEFGTVSNTPFPDIKMARTRSNARPGDIIVGYQITDADVGCFRCSTLTPTGLLLVVLLSLLFFPAAFIICCLPQFHETVQRPIYGPPAPPPAEWMEKVRPHYITDKGYK